MDLQKNIISNASSQVNLNSKNSRIIDFILKNREIGQKIIGYITIEDIAKAPNFYYSELIEIEELKGRIIRDFHNCQVILTIKKILQKTVLNIKNEKKCVTKILRMFRKTKYKKRKCRFYEIAKTEIENKLLVENNKIVSDYILFDDLRYCLLLIDKVIEIYDIKSSNLRILNKEISELEETYSIVSEKSFGCYDSDWCD